GGGVVSAETLLEKAWDENADPFTTAPRVTISTLRKAIGKPDLITTVPGAGYRLTDPRPGRADPPAASAGQHGAVALGLHSAMLPPSWPRGPSSCSAFT